MTRSAGQVLLKESKNIYMYGGNGAQRQEDMTTCLAGQYELP